MTQEKKLGGECYLYRNSATYGSPTWNELTNTEDVSRPDSRPAGEFKTRAQDFVLHKVGKRTLAINFNYVYDPSDDDFDVLVAAYAARTAIEFAAMDGPIATAGTQGLRASYQISEFPIEEPLEEGVKIAVVLVPTISAHDPAWFEVA